MRSRDINFSNKNKVGKGKVPSLVDLCVHVAIDNVRYIGDVGETDSHLLDRILPHCTVEQLMHIENATSGRDLSQVTGKLWKKFYETQFGAQSVELLVKNMAKKKVTWTWRLLYQAKLKQQNEDQKQKVEEMAQKFREENARRQSKEIRIVTKVPPSSKKRSFGGVKIVLAFGGSSSFPNVKSNLMRKAKTEYSAEIKNRVAVKRVVVQTQRNNSVRPMMQPPSSRGNASFSTSKFTK